MDRMVSQARRLKRRLQIKWSRWSIFRYGLRGIFEKKKTEDLEPILKRDGELCSGLPKRVPRNTRMKGRGNCGEHAGLVEFEHRHHCGQFIFHYAFRHEANIIFYLRFLSYGRSI